jgi:branched-subunit amino acid transport protein
MNEVLLIAGMAAVTMAARIPVLMLLSRRKLPEGVIRALRYVPPAVLAAIILPIAVLRDSKPYLAIENATLMASVFAVLIAWWTRNLLLTIVLGMGFLLAWRLLFPL